jgi:hypothetical protein
MPKLIEGYNMLIWENEDGTATYTGSLNQAEWDAYLEKSGKAVKPAADTKDEKPAAKKTSAATKSSKGKEG